MLEKKVGELLSKLEGIESQLGSPEVFSDQKLYRKLTQEHSRLNQLKEVWLYYQRSNKQLIESQDLLLSETDPELIEVIREEIEDLKSQVSTTHKKIEQILVPPDPRDSRNIIMELRAGTGGDEAALFVGDCVRMYKFFSEKMKWKMEVLSTTESDVGGYKEYIMSISGDNVFRFMQYEAGTHRVQRVPETETQGRLHTSAITIAVYLEPTEDEKIEIDEKELQIDTYRASGAGGQHVNTTDSAVRITHAPSGIVVTCQDERSQHKNKDKAMRYLMAKLIEQQARDHQKELADIRASQVGSGDRSERVRTYNFPQNRVTDHRIGLTTHNLDQVMEGELEEISQALVTFFYQQKFE